MNACNKIDKAILNLAKNNPEYGAFLFSLSDLAIEGADESFVEEVAETLPDDLEEKG